MLAIPRLQAILSLRDYFMPAFGITVNIFMLLVPYSERSIVIFTGMVSVCTSSVFTGAESGYTTIWDNFATGVAVYLNLALY